MRNLGWGICGVMLGLVFVLVNGTLEVQVIGQEAGAVLNFNNTMVTVASPRTPLLPLAAIAVLSFLVMLFLTLGTTNLPRQSRWSFVGGFFLATAALITWAFFLTGGTEGPDTTLGILEGWQGWVEKGGRSSAVHVVALLSVASLRLRFDSQHTKSEADTDYVSAEGN